jgi:hypothetical protein
MVVDGSRAGALALGAWFTAARQLLAPFGERGRLSHWTYAVWRSAVAVAVGLSFWLATGGNPRPVSLSEAVDQVATAARHALIVGTTRCLVGALLVIAVTMRMRRVRKLAVP